MPSSSYYLPEMLLAEGRAHTGHGLLVNEVGLVDGLAAAESVPPGTKLIRLPGKALLPGLANTD